MQRLIKIASELQPAHRLFVCCLVLYFGVAQAESDHKNPLSINEIAESTDISHDSINESAGGHPDFSGMWLLDKSASDNPEEIIKASLDKRKKPSFFTGGGMSGRGTDMEGEGFSKPPFGGTDENVPFDKHPPAALSVDHLEIFHSDPELHIVADKIGEQTIFTDLRSTSITALGGLQQKVVIAGWENNDLVIETRTLDGSATVQRLRLLDNPRRLERVTEMSSPDPGRESIVIKQIFNPWTK
jgi:hypothetical protein